MSLQVRTAISLPKKTFKEMDFIAKEEGLNSNSAVIRYCIRQVFNKITADKQNQAS